MLVDRIWPRGVARAGARIDAWLRDAAPSSALRRWFGHDPSRWREFQRRYAAELGERPDVVGALIERARAGRITLVFAARDAEHCNAAALRTFLQRRLARRSPRAGSRRSADLKTRP